MTAFTILRHAAPLVESVVSDLRAGRYVVRGTFTTPRKFTAQEDLYLRANEVAIQTETGFIFASQERGNRPVAHILNLIDLSGTTLRSLTESRSVDSGEEDRDGRPTPMRIVAADRSKAMTCLQRASHSTTYRNPEGILAMLASDEPVTYSRSDLVALLLTTLTVMSADRIDPRLGSPPQDSDGHRIDRVTGFHAIFAEITRAVPVADEA